MTPFALVPLLALLGAPAAPAASPAPASPTLAQSGVVTDWMNRKADPCQDFYEFTCGGFIAKTEIPPDRRAFSASTVVQQEVEQFLRDALEKAARDPGGDPVKQKLGDYWAAC